MAFRRTVPLKSMCSMKWAMPLSPGVSARDPTGTQIPAVADRRYGTRSLTIATPFSSTVLATAIGFRRLPSSPRSPAAPVPVAVPAGPGSLSELGAGPVAGLNRPSSSNSLWESRILPSRSTSRTRTVTSSPSLKHSDALTRFFEIWETWSRPSVPGKISTNTPNSMILRTRPW